MRKNFGQMDCIIVSLIILCLFSCGKKGSPAGPEEEQPVDTTDNTVPVDKTNNAYLFKSGTGGYSCFRIPALIKTTKGTLLAFAEARKNSCSDAGDINMVVKRSEDNGLTWSNMRTVWDDGANTCGNPVPVVDAKTGYIFLLMTWNFERDNYSAIVGGTSEDTRRVFVTHSEDDGLTWTTPEEITDEAKAGDWTWYSTGPCHGIQISQGTYAGRLVIPCSFVEKSTKKAYANIIYSDDDGSTWKLGGIADKAGAGESAVAELSDGKLMLNMRTNVGVRFVATSDDGGLSWDDMLSYTLIDPACQGSLLSDNHSRDHYLFFSNPKSTSVRENMTIQMSRNDGKSWTSSCPIYSGPSGYSDLVMISDKEVGILYESGISSPHDRLAFEIIPLDKFK